MSSSQQPDAESTIARMRDVLKRQQAAFIAEGPPSVELRIARIDKVIALLQDNQQLLCEALASDFSWRSHDQSLMTDVLLPIAGLKYARKHLRQWMKPERRRAELGAGLLGAKAEIHYQPLGSIGVMTPWNFPVAIAFGPLAEAFAAGNRAMIVLSEFNPATAALLIELLAEKFADTEVAAFIGGAEVGAAFSSLPLDHIIFTGSPRVGRLVMRAAAENLTPLTLELGGKSPTIIARGADLDNAARRIWGGKGISSGQACIAPDYVLVHEDDRERLLVSMQAELPRMFPTIRNNPDYTAMATPGQYQRLQSYLGDAEALGVRCIEINPAGEDLSSVRKIAPTLLIDPPQDALVLQEEIFGPLLPICSYRSIDEAIAYINAHDRPLSLYPFSHDRGKVEKILRNTLAGGVTVNDSLLHFGINDLPFGGIGPSGMGAYHGRAGSDLLKPPYSKVARFIDFIIR